LQANTLAGAATGPRLRAGKNPARQGIGADRARFDWLAESSNRRSALRLVLTAVLRGWLNPRGPEHAALRLALLRLVDDPATPMREVLRAIRILCLAVSGERAGQPTRLASELNEPAA
jgi:hypothetical protein